MNGFIMRRLAIIGILLLLLLIPTQAQDGRGVIREGIMNDLDVGTGSFNPLRCFDAACEWAVERLFPRLLAVDPETGWYGAGTAENNALALSWDISADGEIYHFQLREDAFWSDGTPITAYDYFYNYLASTSRDFESPYQGLLRSNIEGVVPLSASELVLIFKDNNCDVLPLIDFPIAPAHAFDAGFAEQAAAFFTDGDVREQWASWNEAFDYDFRYIVGHPFDTNPSITGGEFEFVSWQPREYIRLRNGNLAYELVPVQSQDEAVNLFLNGELTLLNNPPVNRWSDIQAADDVQTYQAPTTRWDYIAFNLTQPFESESAFDEDGNAIEQAPNPYFSDIRIRQAIQMAINVPELIEVGLQGQGTVLAAHQVPLSWAYDDSLSPYAYDPDAARALLEEAGWVQYQGSSTRRCLGCETADEGTFLSISLAYDAMAHHSVVASLITQQLREVGIGINPYSTDFFAATYQDFDMYLGTWYETYPVAVSLDRMFSPEEDVIGEGWNITSYNNPELDALVEQAQTVAGCNLDERRDLYQQAQRILYDDLPYAWLYAHDERVAVRGSVQHFEPIVGVPLGDLTKWVIFEPSN
jgi:peptide/nickel transport system substrate-binding protein